MAKINKNGKSAWIYGIAFIIAILIFCGISWITTCGIIKLITLCFNLTFSWKIATGIWIILCLITVFMQMKSLE